MRRKNDYSISYFDLNKERGNNKYIREYIGNDVLRSIREHECNSTGFFELQTNGEGVYGKSSYNDITGAVADVFHFVHFETIPFELNGKMVVTIHDLLPLLPKAHNWFDESYLFHAPPNCARSLKFLEKKPQTIIIADSYSTKADIMNYSGIKQERVFVVPLAHDATIHYPEKNQALLKTMKIHSPFLLYLGELDFRKGIVDIFDAFEVIKPNFPDLKLVLAGFLKTTTSPIHEKLSEFRYINDVILTGFVNNEQKRALLSSASVFLFPSEYEGFGLPVLEAMACGSPVITTNVSSLPEVGGNAVVYVSPNNPEQLAYEIECLLNSESLRNEYIQKGFKQSSKFSWDKTAQMTEEVYKTAHEQR